MQTSWQGIAWLCEALDVAALASIGAVAPVSPHSSGLTSIHPKDRGLITRARLDADARSKIIRHAATAGLKPPLPERAGGGHVEPYGFSISGIESQGDGTQGLLELYQPSVSAAEDTISWLTEDYHFELDGASAQVSERDSIQ